LSLVGKAVTVFEGGQFQRMHSADEAVNFLIETGIVRIEAGGIQQQVQSAVELVLGALQETVAVEVFAMFDTHPGFDNNQPDGINFRILLQERADRRRNRVGVRRNDDRSRWRYDSHLLWGRRSACRQ